MKHIFDVEIAKIYGVNCAILLENLSYWIEKNKANSTNYYDGYFWTFNSVKAYQKLFPYMSAKQISTALKKLEDEGLIISGNYNSLSYDRTKWYAITQKGNSILQNRQMEEPKKENGFDKNGEPIPNINTNINSDINSNNKSTPHAKKEEKHKYGEYQNVLLTDKELEKLKQDYPNYEELIKYLDEYIEMKGYKAKSHYLAIKKWVVDAVNERKNKTTSKIQNNNYSFDIEEYEKMLRQTPKFD